MVSLQVSSSPTTQGPAVALRAGRRVYQLGLEQAISLAHALVHAKQYEVASRIGEALLRGNVRDPRVKILLAAAKAGLKEYLQCNRIIQAVFQEESKRLDQRLHAVLASRKPAFRAERICALQALADQDQSLVTICLLLADLLESLGEKKQAALCWRLALQGAEARNRTPDRLMASFTAGRQGTADPTSQKPCAPEPSKDS